MLSAELIKTTKGTSIILTSSASFSIPKFSNFRENGFKIEFLSIKIFVGSLDQNGDGNIEFNEFSQFLIPKFN